MASCSANGSNGHHKITMNVTQSSQDVANNKSVVSYSIVLSPLDSGWDWVYNNSDPFTCTYTINGTTRTCTLRKYDGTSSPTLASGTQVVSHNSDGTKTVSFSFSVTSQSASYLIGSCSANGSLTLTTIPRASTFTAGNGTLNTSQKISVTRASTSFTHTLTYKVGSASGTIVTKSTSTEISWTPPTSLGAQNTTGSSLSCTLTLTTYNGNTSIGTSSKTITLTIPSGNPSFTLGTSDTSGNLSTYGSYIKGKSVIRTSLTSVSCTYSATVKSYSVTYRKTNSSGAALKTGTTTTTDWTPNWAGTVHITATVTDSRGRSTSKTTTVTVSNYSNPSVTTLTVGRYSDSAGTTKNDAGEYAKITYAGTYTSLSNKNAAKITVQYKKHSASSWTTAVNASTTLSGTTATFAAAIDSTYDVRATITDNLNPSGITKTAAISTAAVLMHWPPNGNGISFGKMAETYDALEVGYSWIYMKRNGQPSFVMHRTDLDTQARFYLTSDEEPWFRFQFKHKNDADWRSGMMMSEGYLAPSSNEAMSLGMTSSRQWSSVYSKNFFENGTLLANKYNSKITAFQPGGSASIANKSMSSSTSWQNIGSFSLTAGLYLVIVFVHYASNTSGYRAICINTTSGEGPGYVYLADSAAPVNGYRTLLRIVSFLNPSSTTTYYIDGIQNSGSTLTATTRFSYIKIE